MWANIDVAGGGGSLSECVGCVGWERRGKEWCVSDRGQRMECGRARELRGGGGAQRMLQSQSTRHYCTARQLFTREMLQWIYLVLLWTRLFVGRTHFLCCSTGIARQGKRVCLLPARATSAGNRHSRHGVRSPSY